MFAKGAALVRLVPGLGNWGNLFLSQAAYPDKRNSNGGKLGRVRCRPARSMPHIRAT